jgi:hypothetical protein
MGGVRMRQKVVGEARELAGRRGIRKYFKIISIKMGNCVVLWGR